MQSRMEILLAELEQTATGLVAEGDKVGRLFAQAVYDVRGGLGGKAGIGEAGFVGGYLFVQPCEFFGEALALGGDVDLALVDDGDIEAGGRARIRAGERLV